jgi:DNA-binding HxlR family transcriptional regulator
MSCSTEWLIDQIGDRWTLQILHRLAGGTRRTQGLLGSLAGISSRTLAAKLKALEADGWIERTVFAEVPPRVEYSLTEKGRRLRPVFAAMQTISQSWSFAASKERKAVPCPSCEAPPLKSTMREVRKSKPVVRRPSIRLIVSEPEPPGPPPEQDEVVLL